MSAPQMFGTLPSGGTFVRAAPQIEPVPDSPRGEFFMVGTEQARHGTGFALPWRAVLTRLLRELGLQPGERLLVRQLDGSTRELPLPALDEPECEQVHEL